MLFDDAAKRYPSLVQALNVLARAPAAPERNGAIFAAILAVAIILTPKVAVLNMALLILLVVGVALVFHFNRRAFFRRGMDPRSTAAREVAQRMGMMIAKRRLHRDLDAGSLTLLDECARQWLRSRAALDNPVWRSRTTPEHYRDIRERATLAMDDAMADVLLHYRDVVPADVTNRHALDYVDEALDNIVSRGPARGGRRDTRFPPSAFEPVREIADRLRDLAQETERATQELRGDTLVTAGQDLPPSKLDQTLSELRAIRQAEDELRQDLRG